MSMGTNNEYKYLETRPGLYRQPFMKGSRIRVEIPYGHTFDHEDEEEGFFKGQTPEELAKWMHVPVEAVREAIDYCQNHWDVIVADHAREDRLFEARGMNHPDYKWDPGKYYKIISAEEYNRIIND